MPNSLEYSKKEIMAICSAFLAAQGSSSYTCP